jgi:signal transduction histidine kinase
MSTTPGAPKGPIAILKAMPGAVRASLVSGVRGPYAEELRAAQREVILSRTVVLIWISVFVMPTTILLYVYLLAPDHFGSAVWIVLAAVGAVLVHRSLVVRGVFNPHYHVAMLLLVGGVFGPTGAAIAEISRASGDFFFAFFLIFFAFTSLFPADVRWVVLTSLAVMASYAGARTFRPEGLLFSAELISNLIYLGQLTFIGVVLNRVVCKLFFDEKLVRIELAQANQGLMELDQAKTAFFSNVSHEIRTPLTLILTPLQQLLNTRFMDLPPDVIEKLQSMRANASRLLKMVNMILDFAKLEAGQAKVNVSSFVLDELARYTVDLFKAVAESKHIKLEVEALSGDARMSSDLDKIEKILVNLVGNAIKFTPPGGTITVRVTKKDELAELSVQDTGIGIAPEDLGKLFQRFAQIEGDHQKSVKGTGIGLAMVKEYAKLLGGDARVESEVGRGSTFSVVLPWRVSGEAEKTAPEAPKEQKLDSQLAAADIVVHEDGPRIRQIDKAGPGKPRVLCVDDNPALLSLVSSILEQDYNLFLASDAKEALQRLEADRVDLLISDVMMPGISGLDLCRKIKTNPKTSHLPVVLLTARGAVAQKIEGLEYGADEYLGKPFDPEELKVRIRSIFELRRLTRSLATKSQDLEVALVRLKEEEVKVIAAEKLRTLGELAAGVFHEVHNYINMIHNGAAPLKEALQAMKSGTASGFEPGELVELAGVVAEASDAALEVTKELKSFARHNAERPKPADLHDLIRSTVRLFGRRDADHRIDLDLASQQMVVECVASKLTLVFANLVKNAFEAMGGKGAVSISTQAEGGNAIVYVTDRGPGVPKEIAARLFEPFFTTKKQGEGLGLGLSLARKSIQDSGGDLYYDDTHSGGARFVIRLPLIGEARTKSSERPSAASLPVQ